MKRLRDRAFARIVHNRIDKMRMLSLDEIRAAMGFPSDYQLPAAREHATKMLGNAIVPQVAEAAVRAVLEAA
jgi:DNA (cytosine-5)-methyltransferase 1